MFDSIDWTQISRMHLSMTMVLAMVVCFLIALLWVWHRDSESRIDLKDLICKDGHLDEKKFTRFGAWVISTWAFIYLIVNKPEQFPEWYFVGYMAVWVGNAIMDKYMNKKEEEK